MNGFPVETLELLQKTAVEAKGAQGKTVILPIPGDPQGQMLVVGPDGNYDELEPSPKPRAHQLLSIDQVGVAAQKYHASTVFFSPERVTLVLDDGSDSRRLDQIFCQLSKTPAFKFFQDKAAESWLPQKLMVRLLRVNLADALTDSSAQLLKALRLVTFAENRTGYGRQELGRESLGRDIEAEITTAGELPEVVKFNIRVFTDQALTLRLPFACAFDVNNKDELFNLTPLAGEIERLVDESMERLETLLGDSLGDVSSTATLIYGSP